MKITKHNSESPDCDDENFMTNFSRKIFHAEQGGEDTHIEIYHGDHGWPADANKWLGEFMVDILYP